MPEINTQATTDSIPNIVLEDDMSFSKKKEKIESCALSMSRKGISKNHAFAICNSSIGGAKKASEIDGFIKQFADKDFNNFTGITKKGGGVKHTHSYVVMVLNYGESIVGVTTNTNGSTPHVHTINLRLDSKIIAIEANTDYSGIKESIDKVDSIEDYHDHSFKADIEKIRNEVSSIYVRSMYFNENGEFVEGNAEEALKLARGEGKGVGGQRQGDGGADTCYCSECGHTMSHEKGKSCSDLKCPECGGAMKGTNTTLAIFPETSTSDGKSHYFVDNKRQAEILLNRVCSINESPKWFKNDIDTFQATVFNSIEKQFTDMDLSSNTVIEEVRIYLAAKGKINSKINTTKGSAIFPSNSSNVKDKKDHFPISSISQARNALARVAQYKKVPSWYNGTLAALQQKVRRAVKDKYPSIKVTKMTEFFAIRFKEELDVHFIFLGTTNINTLVE